MYLAGYKGVPVLTGLYWVAPSVTLQSLFPECFRAPDAGRAAAAEPARVLSKRAARRDAVPFRLSRWW